MRLLLFLIVFLVAVPGLLATSCPVTGSVAIATPQSVEVDHNFSVTVHVDDAIDVGLTIGTDTVYEAGDTGVFGEFTATETGKLLLVALANLNSSFVEVGRCNLTITPPPPECESDEECEDDVLCTIDSCRDGACEHANKSAGSICIFDPLHRCAEPLPGENAACLPSCSLVDGECLATPPENASLVNGHYCSDGACYRCWGGYEWQGKQCVLTSSCTGDICMNATHLLPCDEGEWTVPRSCYLGCENDACVNACVDVEVCAEEGASRCRAGGVETCGFHSLGCLYWGGFTACDTACEDGTCLDGGCDGEPSYYCDGREGYYRDACGEVELRITCPAGVPCLVEADDVVCDPCPGLDRCGSRCVNLQTSNIDCGACGNICIAGLTCQHGSCLEDPGCDIRCERNADCDQGEVCLYPGDCTQSRCVVLQSSQEQDVPEEEVRRIFADLSRGSGRFGPSGAPAGAVDVTVVLTGKTFRYRVTNHLGIPLHDVTFSSSFQKSIAEHADELVVKGVAYEVIQEDPVLRFRIDELEEEYVFTVTASHGLDESFINYVYMENVSFEEPDLLKHYARSEEEFSITITSEFDGEDTDFTVGLDTATPAEDVTIPVQVPKCLAEHVDDLELYGNYRIIVEDPLIVWRFDSVEDQVAVLFSVPGDIDEECRQQLRAIAYARHFKKPLNPWLLLVLVPILVIGVFIILERFPQIRERLSRKEFFSFGKRGGMTEEQLEDEWFKYNKRQ